MQRQRIVALPCEVAMVSTAGDAPPAKVRRVRPMIEQTATVRRHPGRLDHLRERRRQHAEVLALALQEARLAALQHDDRARQRVHGLHEVRLRRREAAVLLSPDVRRRPDTPLPPRVRRAPI